MNEPNSLLIRFMQPMKGFILGTIVTPGNVHESHWLQPLVEKVIEKVKKPIAVATDAACKTPAITNFLLDNQILPVLPYTRPKQKRLSQLLEIFKKTYLNF